MKWSSSTSLWQDGRLQRSTLPAVFWTHIQKVRGDVPKQGRSDERGYTSFRGPTWLERDVLEKGQFFFGGGVCFFVGSYTVFCILLSISIVPLACWHFQLWGFSPAGSSIVPLWFHSGVWGIGRHRSNENSSAAPLCLAVVGLFFTVDGVGFSPAVGLRWLIRKDMVREINKKKTPN